MPPAEPEAPDFARPDIDELTAYWFGSDPVESPKPAPSQSRAYKPAPVVVEEEEPAELEAEPEDPTTRARRRMATRVVLAVSGFVVVGVIVLVAAMFFTSRSPSGPAAADPLIVVPESSAGAESPFAGLLPTATAEPSACWQAVVGTFETESAAQEGADRLGDVGLPGVVLPSESVPEWGAGSFVASVMVGSESLAGLALERAGLAGFGGGSAVEAPVADCDGSSVVTTALGLGFLDVPTSRPDAAGIGFASSTGLLEACVSPDSGLFCPEEPASVDDVASIARAIDAAAPGTGTVATELTVLAQAAGLPDPGVPPGGELSRGDLANYLLETHESFGS